MRYAVLIFALGMVACTVQAVAVTPPAYFAASLSATIIISLSAIGKAKTPHE